MCPPLPRPRRSIIMTASSTLLALVLMPLCLWVYSRHWINTALVRLLPLGAVSLTLGSTLLPIGLGVLIRYRHPRAADLLVKVGTTPGMGGGGVSNGSQLSGPSEPMGASHGHIPLFRWDIRMCRLDIKRWDGDRKRGEGQVTPPKHAVLHPGRQSGPWRRGIAWYPALSLLPLHPG